MGRFNLGLMQVRTAEERGVLGEDFTVFRPKLQFFSQSYVGFIYTRRATQDSKVPDRHTIGMDFELATARFRDSKNLRFNGFFIKTANGVKNGDDLAYGFRVTYPNDLWSARTSLRVIQKNVDPAVGFIQFADQVNATPVLRFAPRPNNNRWIRQVGVEIFGDFFTEMNGEWIERTLRFTLIDLTMQSGDTLRFQVTPSYIRLRNDFRIAEGITLPEGNEYEHTRYSFRFSTANQRQISGSGSVTVGTFHSGHRRDLSANLNVRPRRGVLATVLATFNRIELPEGNLSTKIVRAIVNTQFSPFVSVSNNVQYDSVSWKLGWQFRFRWIPKPGNDVYVVWLNNWLDSGDRLTTVDRSGATKLVYTHRF